MKKNANMFSLPGVVWKMFNLHIIIYDICICHLLEMIISCLHFSLSDSLFDLQHLHWFYWLFWAIFQHGVVYDECYQLLQFGSLPCLSWTDFREYFRANRTSTRAVVRISRLPSLAYSPVERDSSSTSLCGERDTIPHGRFWLHEAKLHRRLWLHKAKLHIRLWWTFSK